MNSPLPMHLSPRCSARSKRTGEGCKAPAVTGWKVCRFHGARGGGPKGECNGSYRHGRFTCEAIARRRELSGWVKAMAQFAKEVK
jgi:hypothetical protein